MDNIGKIGKTKIGFEKYHQKLKGDSSTLFNFISNQASPLPANRAQKNIRRDLLMFSRE